MLKQTRKNYITRLFVTLVACVIAFAISASVLTAQAAVRSSIIFEENFRALELSGNSWTKVYDDEENDKISHYTGGNGSFVVNFARTGNMSNTLYLDKYVDVKDTEDLIIEYSVKDFIDSENAGGLITNLMLVKGLGSETEKPSASIRDDVDAKLEGIASFKEGSRYSTGIGYSLRSGVTAVKDSSDQVSIANTERSQAVKDYYNSLFTPVYDGNEFLGYNVPWGFDNVSSDMDNGLPFTSVRFWCGEKFDDYLWGSDDQTKILTSQEEIDAYSIYHIFQKGFTFKHVYKATGGYDCFVKANGLDDSNYVLFANLSDTFGFEQNDEKRFSNRSGYIGINSYGEKASIEFDNFTVYTQEGDQKTMVADEGFELVDGERYGNGENKSAFAIAGSTSAISTDANYDEIGCIFDNADAGNYLYTSSSSKKKIVHDGRFDDYAIIDVDLSIKELTPDKNFGLVIGGTDIDHLLERERNIFVYLTSREGFDNYLVGVDYVFKGYRNNIGSIMDTGIPVENSGDHTYNLRITAKQDLSLVVSIFDEDGQKTTEDITFKQEGAELILRNRIAIYSGNSETIAPTENSSAVVVLKNLSVHNTYFYSFSSATLKGISENFDTPSVGNDFILSKGVSVYIGERSPRIQDADMFVKDGVLNMVGVGHKSGIVSEYAYNSFEMTFDIVDMQRTISNGLPVCSAPIVMQFGAIAEGIDTGTGKSLVIRNPLKIETSEGVKRINGEDDMSIDLAVPDTDRVSNLAFGHDGVNEDFGVLRHNLLDPALDGKVIRCKLSYTEDSVLSFSYCVLGEEDESLLDQPVFSKFYMGGEGYLALTSTHSSVSALSAIMKIDNFNIVSTDTFTDPSEDESGDASSDGEFVWDVIWPNDPINQKKDEGCFSQVSPSYYLLALLFVVPCIKFLDRKKLLKKKENQR